MRSSIVQDSTGSYHIKYATKLDILQLAGDIMEEKMKRYGSFKMPQSVLHYISARLTCLQSERFCVMYLDCQHKLIKFDVAFKGTINRASVHPREIVKRALELNAGAVIFAHNHPSGDPTPSQSDIALTKTLKDILCVIDVNVLDHIIVGVNDTVSFTERGLL